MFAVPPPPPQPAAARRHKRAPIPPPRHPQGLQQFLLTTLGEAGLRRLARQIDLAASALHAVLLDAALPRLSLAAFALGEMRGLAAAAGGLQQLGLEVRARARPQFGWGAVCRRALPGMAACGGTGARMGAVTMRPAGAPRMRRREAQPPAPAAGPPRLLYPSPTNQPLRAVIPVLPILQKPSQPHGVEALELCAVRALLRAERLRLVVGGAACQYRCFFSWLLRVLRMLDTQGR